MTSEPTPLLDRVADMLERSHVPFALIDAAAQAVHGVSRSTLDIDLLATDRRLLDATFWTALPEAVRVDIRQGDSTDPLAGVVRCRAAGERDVDVVLGTCNRTEIFCLAARDAADAVLDWIHESHGLPARSLAAGPRRRTAGRPAAGRGSTGRARA